MCERSDEFLDLQSAPTFNPSTPVSPFSPLTFKAEPNPFSLKASQSQPTPDNQASIYLFHFANI